MKDKNGVELTPEARSTYNNSHYGEKAKQFKAEFFRN